MTVKELNQDQLSELKSNYYYGDGDTEEGHEDEYDSPDDVPNEVIYEHYADYEFDPDDFGCEE